MSKTLLAIRLGGSSNFGQYPGIQVGESNYILPLTWSYMSKENYRTAENFRDYTLSDYLRHMGQMLYTSDIDSIVYTYKEGKLDNCALIDYKHGSAELGGSFPSAIQAQLALADSAGLPFFFAYYWLLPDFPVPMFFLRAGNDLAIEKLHAFEKTHSLIHVGRWFSAYDYSRFQYYLRDMKFYNTTKLSKDEVLTVGSLSREYHEYELPAFRDVT